MQPLLQFLLGKKMLVCVCFSSTQPPWLLNFFFLKMIMLVLRETHSSSQFSSTEFWTGGHNVGGQTSVNETDNMIGECVVDRQWWQKNRSLVNLRWRWLCPFLIHKHELVVVFTVPLVVGLSKKRNLQVWLNKLIRPGHIVMVRQSKVRVMWRSVFWKMIG